LLRRSRRPRAAAQRIPPGAAPARRPPAYLRRRASLRLPGGRRLPAPSP